MRNDREYQLCSAISKYLRYQYPGVIFHYDYAGLNLSKSQSGKMKAIQGLRGFPDLFIAEPRHPYKGLFLELKADGAKLLKQDGSYATPHLQEQSEMLYKLRLKGYWATFAVGFDQCKNEIDSYLK